MTELSWGTPGERFYESGVDRGVLFVDSVGVAWNGLVSVKENPSGGDPTPYYIDGYKFSQIALSEDFQATLEAFSSPREFRACDGSKELMSGLTVTQQRRKQFGLSYRTRIGNDVEATDFGYKIHILYNAMTGPSSRDNNTIAASPSPITLSWDISTQPPQLSGSRPTSHFVIDSTRTDPEVLTSLTDILYGSDSTDSRLPTPSELVGLFA